MIVNDVILQDSGGTKNNMFKDFGPVPTQINDVSCNHPETIHASTITVPKYTTLPDNSAQTIKLLCRIDFITLKDQLESNLSEQLQMAGTFYGCYNLGWLSYTSDLAEIAKNMDADKQKSSD